MSFSVRLLRSTPLLAGPAWPTMPCPASNSIWGSGVRAPGSQGCVEEEVELGLVTAQLPCVDGVDRWAVARRMQNCTTTKYRQALSRPSSCESTCTQLPCVLLWAHHWPEGEGRALSLLWPASPSTVGTLHLQGHLQASTGPERLQSRGHSQDSAPSPQA